MSMIPSIVLNETSEPGSALSYCLTMHQICLELHRKNPSAELAELVIEFEVTRDYLWERHRRQRSAAL